MTLYYDVALVCRIDKEFAEAPDGKVQKQAAASRSPLASGGSAILYPSLSILGWSRAMFDDSQHQAKEDYAAVPRELRVDQHQAPGAIFNHFQHLPGAIFNIYTRILCTLML